MNGFDKLQLLAELAGDNCGLNHGPETRQEDYAAVNYIAVPFGHKENALKEVEVRELVIPVCFECAQALNENEWTLIYCFECSNSRWIYRRLAKNNYQHHILWLRGCPDCSNKFGGLYFNDPLAIAVAEFPQVVHEQLR